MSSLLLKLLLRLLLLLLLVLLLLLLLPDSATIDAMLLLTSGPQTCGFAAKSIKEWRVELVLFLANILHVPALVLLEGGGRGGGGVMTYMNQTHLGMHWY